MKSTLHDQKHHHHHHHRDGKIPREYFDLTAADIPLLTQILSHAPKLRTSTLQGPYERIVRDQIAGLPSHLRTKFPWLTSFCSLHHRIHPRPVTGILAWLEDELERRVREVWVPLRDRKELDPEQDDMLALLLGLGEVWRSGSKAGRKCGACVLARVGGDERLLVAIGAYFVGRVRSGVWRRSRRVWWIEAWIRGAVDAGRGDDVVGRMWDVGMQLRGVRKGNRKSVADRPRVDSLEKTAVADHELAGNARGPARRLLQPGEWMGQVAADELFDEDETSRHPRPPREGASRSQKPDRARDGAWDEDLEASQLFRAPSSVYSQWSRTSSHDTESELIEMYRHSTLTQMQARQQVDSAVGVDERHNGKGKERKKDPELAKFPRHWLAPVTKPRGNFF